MRQSLLEGLVAAGCIVLLAASCGPAPMPSRTGSAASEPGRPAQLKSITIGISNAVDALSIMGSSTTAGGWQPLNELHSQGLVTADRDVQRPVPRLATQVPSFDNGAIEMLPDGRMKSVYEGYFLGRPKVDRVIVRVYNDETVLYSAVLAEDLPLILLYFNATTPAVRKGVKALDDFRGSAEASRLFGTVSRNSHEWDVL